MAEPGMAFASRCFEIQALAAGSPDRRIGGFSSEEGVFRGDGLSMPKWSVELQRVCESGRA